MKWMFKLLTVFIVHTVHIITFYLLLMCISFILYAVAMSCISLQCKCLFSVFLLLVKLNWIELNGDLTDCCEQMLCSVIAGILHFVFLVAFAWMCLEGIQLYVMLIEVFEVERSRIRWYYAAGYGMPWYYFTISLYTVNFWHMAFAVSKGMRAVKLCTNKILQFLTGGAG